MKIKKYIILIAILLAVIIAFYFIKKPKSPSLNLACAKEGEGIGSCVCCMTKCCDGLESMFHLKFEGVCLPSSADGFGATCSYCGNNICDKQNEEDECNCPQDCDASDTEEHCGNDMCESEYNENNQNCTEDCPIPIIGTRTLSNRTDLQNYYEPFRKKCVDDKCCLDSFEKAKKLRSEIFVWVDGKMPLVADCPTGYSLQKDECETSYMWCEETKNKYN